MAHLQSVDVVRHLQLVQLLLYVCNDLQLELGAAQQVKGHTGQQHVDGMLDGNCVSSSGVCTMKRTYSTSTHTSHWAARCNTWLLIELTPKGIVFSFSFLDTSQLAFQLRLTNIGEGPFSG